jgi:integrase/recombinase XerD
MAAPRELDLTTTLLTAWESWREHLSARVEADVFSPDSMRNYLSYSLRMVQYLGADRSCDSIEATEVAGWLSGYRATGVSPATLRHCHKAAKGLFTWAWDQRWLRENPMRDVPAPPVPQRRAGSERAALSRPEYDAVLAAARTGHGSANGTRGSWVRDEVVVRLAGESGLRNADIRDLDIADIEQAPEGYWVAQIRRGKGRKARTTPITDTCAVLIRDYLDHWRPAHGGLPDRYDTNRKLIKGDECALLLTTERHRLNSGSVRYIVDRVAKAALGRHFVPHGLRHTAGTLLVREARADLAVVAHVLGHSDISVTSVYLDTSGDEAAAAVNRRKTGTTTRKTRPLPAGPDTPTWEGCGSRTTWNRHKREKVPMCGPCRMWRREAVRELEILRSLMPARLHGTVTGWQDWRCRCELCRDAHANPPKRAVSESASCGTEAAHQRHLRRAETCEECAAAHGVWLEARRTPRGIPACGTVAAYKRHRRHGEQACPDCLGAVAEASRAYMATASAERRRSGGVRPKAVCAGCDGLRAVTADGVIRKHGICPGSGEPPVLAPLRLATDPELWQAGGQQDDDVRAVSPHPTTSKEQ